MPNSYANSIGHFPSPAPRLVFLCALTMLLWACGGGQPAACGGLATQPLRPVPDISGRSVEDGSALALPLGVTTVVNIWGSWCAPCRTEQPLLTEYAKSHPDIAFVGVNVQDGEAQARAFQQEFAAPYPSIFDFSRERAGRLGVVSTPGTVVIDEGGTMVAVTQGAVDHQLLDCMVALARSRAT